MDPPSPTPTVEHCPTCRGCQGVIQERLATVASQLAELADMVQAIGIKVEAEGFLDEPEEGEWLAVPYST